MTQTAADTTGMRLARVQVLRQGGTTIGCRFYALQGSPLATSEHLPGPNQPVVEITSSTFANTIAAHNALARLADAGTDPAQYTISDGIVGVAFRIRFDPSDGAKDWAVAFNKDSTLVVIKTAISNTSDDALGIEPGRVRLPQPALQAPAQRCVDRALERPRRPGGDECPGPRAA